MPYQPFHCYPPPPMPEDPLWPGIKLYDGKSIPGLAFGTDSPSDTTGHVLDALEVGFRHIGELAAAINFLVHCIYGDIDTAQHYTTGLWTLARWRELAQTAASYRAVRRKSITVHVRAREKAMDHDKVVSFSIPTSEKS
jgi:hypothetical protein